MLLSGLPLLASVESLTGQVSSVDAISPFKGTREICNQTDGGGGLSRSLLVQNLRISSHFQDPVGPPPMS